MKSVRLIFLIIGVLFILSCQSFRQKDTLTTEEQLGYLTAGQAITAESFRALSGELMQALQDGGVGNAIGYCHLQASPIIDSLSKAHGASIHRVSDKYRNPGNKPGDLDLIVLQAYREQIALGRELRPHLEVTGKEVIYYSPITVQNPACLLCHGIPGETLDPAGLEVIRSKYPQDLATGYALHELRGLWKIVLDKEM